MNEIGNDSNKVEEYFLDKSSREPLRLEYDFDYFLSLLLHRT